MTIKVSCPLVIGINARLLSQLTEYSGKLRELPLLNMYKFAFKKLVGHHSSNFTTTENSITNSELFKEFEHDLGDDNLELPDH